MNSWVGKWRIVAISFAAPLFISIGFLASTILGDPEDWAGVYSSAYLFFAVLLCLPLALSIWRKEGHPEPSTNWTPIVLFSAPWLLICVSAVYPVLVPEDFKKCNFDEYLPGLIIFISVVCTALTGALLFFLLRHKDRWFCTVNNQDGTCTTEDELLSFAKKHSGLIIAAFIGQYLCISYLFTIGVSLHEIYQGCTVKEGGTKQQGIRKNEQDFRWCPTQSSLGQPGGSTSASTSLGIGVSPQGRFYVPKISQETLHAFECVFNNQAGHSYTIGFPDGRWEVRPQSYAGICDPNPPPSLEHNDNWKSLCAVVRGIQQRKNNEGCEFIPVLLAGHWSSTPPTDSRMTNTDFASRRVENVRRWLSVALGGDTHFVRFFDLRGGEIQLNPDGNGDFVSVQIGVWSKEHFGAVFAGSEAERSILRIKADLSAMKELLGTVPGDGEVMPLSSSVGSLRRTVAGLESTVGEIQKATEGVKKTIEPIRKEVEKVAEIPTVVKDIRVELSGMMKGVHEFIKKLPPGLVIKCSMDKPRPLLDYLLHITSRTGFEGVVPVSPFAKFVLLLHGLIELFFLVIFSTILFSIVLSRDD